MIEQAAAAGGEEAQGRRRRRAAAEADGDTALAATKSGSTAEAGAAAGTAKRLEAGEGEGEGGEYGVDDELLGEEDDEGEYEEGLDDYADFDMLDGGDGDGGDDGAMDEADTANLAELFRQSQREKAEFLALNVSLQEKLAGYLASVKKSEEGKDEKGPAVGDQEQRYFKCLSQARPRPLPALPLACPRPPSSLTTHPRPPGERVRDEARVCSGSTSRRAR